MTTTSGFSNEEIVDAFYLAFFGRAADKGGRAYWLKELAVSNEVNKLADAMLSTMEHPPAGPFNALVMIYQGLFGKAVDVGADEYWLPVLEGKGIGEAVLEILKVGMATDPSTPGQPTVHYRLAVKDHQLQAQQTQGMSLEVEEARAIMSGVNDHSASKDSATAAIDQQTGLRVQGGAAGVTLLAGATVFADANGNGRLDEGEAHTQTDANGQYVLDRAHGPLNIVGAGGAQGTALDHLRADPHSGDINAFTTLAQILAAADPRYADPQFADQALRTAFGLNIGTGQLDDALRQLGQADAPADHAQSDALILANLAILDLLHAVDTSLASAAKLSADDTELQATASASAMQALADAVNAAATSGHALDMDHPDTVGQVMQAAAANFGEAAGTAPDLTPYVASVATQMTRAQESYQQTLSADGDAGKLAVDNATAAQSLDTTIDVVTNPPPPPEPPTPPVTPDPPPPPPPPPPPVVPDPLILTLAQWNAPHPTQQFSIKDSAENIGGADLNTLAALAADSLCTGISAGGNDLNLTVEQFNAITNAKLDAQDRIQLFDAPGTLVSFITQTSSGMASKVDSLLATEDTPMTFTYSSKLDAGLVGKLSPGNFVSLVISDNVISDSNFQTILEGSSIDEFSGDGTVSKAQFDLMAMPNRIQPAAKFVVDLAAWIEIEENMLARDDVIPLLLSPNISHLSSYSLVMDKSFVDAVIAGNTGDTPVDASDWVNRPDRTTLADTADVLSQILLGTAGTSIVKTHVDAFDAIPASEASSAGTINVAASTMIALGTSKFSMGDSYLVLYDIDSPATLTLDGFTGESFAFSSEIVVGEEILSASVGSHTGGLNIKATGMDGLQYLSGGGGADYFQLAGAAARVWGGVGDDIVEIGESAVAHLQFAGNAVFNGKDIINGFKLKSDLAAGVDTIDVSQFINSPSLSTAIVESSAMGSPDFSFSFGGNNVVRISVPALGDIREAILSLAQKDPAAPSKFVVIEGQGIGGDATTTALWYVNKELNTNSTLELEDIQQVAVLITGQLSDWSGANLPGN